MTDPNIIIPLSEYNQLVEFEKQIKSGKRALISIGNYNYEVFITDEERVLQLSEKSQLLNDEMQDIKEKSLIGIIKWWFKLKAS